MSRPNNNKQDKFQELVLYIAEKSKDDENFGATKLNKIMFYADFMAFYEFGRSITNAEYQKLPQGPAPRPILPVIRTLQASGEIAEENRDRWGLKQKRVVAIRSPDTSIFSSDELELVDFLLKTLGDLNATHVSEFSHCELGWQVAENGETIPYSTVFVGSSAPTPEVIARGTQIAHEVMGERL